MNINFFQNVEYVKENLEFSDNSTSGDESISQDFLILSFQRRQRFLNRISYFKKLKQKFELPDEIEEIYLRLIDYLYYKSSVNHSFFIKKVCDYYNIPCNIKNSKNKLNEIIFNDFLNIHNEEIKIQ